MNSEAPKLPAAPAPEQAAAPTGAPKQVWVFLEVWDGDLAPVSRELLGRARELAGDLGGVVAGVLLGAGVSEVAGTAFAAGADRVYVADDPRLAHYTTQPYARVLGDLARAAAPEIILFGATSLGRDLAPRLSPCGGPATRTAQSRSGRGQKRASPSNRACAQIRACGGNGFATLSPHRPNCDGGVPVFPASPPRPGRRGDTGGGGTLAGDPPLRSWSGENGAAGNLGRHGVVVAAARAGARRSLRVGNWPTWVSKATRRRGRGGVRHDHNRARGNVRQITRRYSLCTLCGNEWPASLSR